MHRRDLIVLRLPDLQRIDRPISLRKRIRVVRHILLARRRQPTAPGLAPDKPRPLPAEGGVEDDAQIAHVVIDVEIAGEIRERSAPEFFAWVGCAGVDVGGDPRAWEEPDLDEFRGPVRGVDAAADGVEARAVGAVVVGGDGAAGVVRLAWS